MRTFLALLILLVLVFTAEAATYYVSPTGSDTNVGSAGAPFKTLAKAATLVNPGDTVVAADGVYYENYQGQGLFGLSVNRGGTESAPVVFQSATPREAIIDGNNTVQIGLYIQAPYVQIQGFQVRNFSREGVSVVGQYVTIKGNAIHNNGSSLTVSQSNGHNGVYTSETAVGCTIDGNVIYKNGRLSLAPSAPGGQLDQGIYLCSPNSTVQNNEIYANQAYGIQIAGYVPLGSTLVQGNTIANEQNAGGIAVWQAGAKGCIIQNNTVIGTAGWGLYFLQDGGGHNIQKNRFYGLGINPAGVTQWTGAGNVITP